MNPSDAYRVLAFEQLEAKRSPTSLLLLLAPLDDSLHDQSETAVHERQVDTTAHWRQHHSAVELLDFVEQQTANTGQVTRPWTTPDPVACAATDEMMKLQDVELYALVDLGCRHIESENDFAW